VCASTLNPKASTLNVRDVLCVCVILLSLSLTHTHTHADLGSFIRDITHSYETWRILNHLRDAFIWYAYVFMYFGTRNPKRKIHIHMRLNASHPTDMTQSYDTHTFSCILGPETLNQNPIHIHMRHDSSYPTDITHSQDMHTCSCILGPETLHQKPIFIWDLTHAMPLT